MICRNVGRRERERERVCERTQKDYLSLANDIGGRKQLIVEQQTNKQTEIITVGEMTFGLIAF